MSYETGLDFALAEDAIDTLAPLRSEFCFPDRPPGADRVLYLCGNSLGLQPRGTAELVGEELEDWRRLGVEGHWKARRPWMPYHENVAGSLAGLVGAERSEVVAMNSLTVNLHLMMVSFFRPRGERRRILIEKQAFPSDRYAVVSQLAFHGLDPSEDLLEIGPRPGEHTIREADIADLLTSQGPRIALVMLPGVQYLSGQNFDLEGLTRLARHQGCTVGYDLAHAIGNVPLHLHDWNADFAVWCHYKYLNAGPGAVGGCFVHERHARKTSLPRFAGWWGHDKASRFRMGPDFHPIPGAEGWQLSNPPVLALAPLLASLALFDRAGMSALRAKSVQLTGYLEFLVNRHLGQDIEIITPQDPGQRGCQLSLRLRAGAEKGRQLASALPERGVFVDWREPDVIRTAPVPLYNSYEDVFHFVHLLQQLVSP